MSQVLHGSGFVCKINDTTVSVLERTFELTRSLVDGDQCAFTVRGLRADLAISDGDPVEVRDKATSKLLFRGHVLEPTIAPVGSSGTLVDISVSATGPRWQLDRRILTTAQAQAVNRAENVVGQLNRLFEYAGGGYAAGTVYAATQRIPGVAGGTSIGAALALFGNGQYVHPNGTVDIVDTDQSPILTNIDVGQVHADTSDHDIDLSTVVGSVQARGAPVNFVLRSIIEPKGDDGIGTITLRPPPGVAILSVTKVVARADIGVKASINDELDGVWYPNRSQFEWVRTMTAEDGTPPVEVQGTWRTEHVERPDVVPPVSSDAMLDLPTSIVADIIDAAKTALARRSLPLETLTLDLVPGVRLPLVIPGDVVTCSLALQEALDVDSPDATDRWLVDRTRTKDLGGGASVVLMLTRYHPDSRTRDFYKLADDVLTSAGEGIVLGDTSSAPEVVKVIGSRTIKLGAAPFIDLTDYFVDPNQDALNFDVQVGDTSVCDAYIANDELHMPGTALGTTTITVTASDRTQSSAQSFEVTVVANLAPVVKKQLPDLTLIRTDTREYDLTEWFSDPDGDSLSFSATSTNTALVTTSIAQNLLTVTAVDVGNVVVRVHATDGEKSVSQSFRVTVFSSAPAKPDKPTLTPVSPNKIRADWTAPNDGGSPIIRTDLRIRKYKWEDWLSLTGIKGSPPVSGGIDYAGLDIDASGNVMVAWRAGNDAYVNTRGPTDTAWGATPKRLTTFVAGNGFRAIARSSNGTIYAAYYERRIRRYPVSGSIADIIPPSGWGLSGKRIVGMDVASNDDLYIMTGDADVVVYDDSAGTWGSQVSGPSGISDASNPAQGFAVAPNGDWYTISGGTSPKVWIRPGGASGAWEVFAASPSPSDGFDLDANGSPVVLASQIERYVTEQLSGSRRVLGTGTTYLFENLEEQVQYDASLRSRNRAAIGPWSDWSDRALTPVVGVPGKPDAPTGLSLGGQRIQWSWEAPLNDGGSDLTDWDLEIRLGATGTPDDKGITGLIVTYRDTGLQLNGQYQARVRVANASGESPWSDWSTAVTAALIGPPSKPQPPWSDEYTNTTITWKWAAPFNSGSAITDYDLEVREGITGTPEDQGVTGAGLSFKDVGLQVGTAYEARVRATNAGGTSAWSDWSDVFVPQPPKPPSRPTAPTAHLISQFFIRWAWRRPLSNGSPITGYNLQVRRGTQGNPKNITGDGPATQRSSGGLNPSTGYQARVRAVNAFGTSAWSDWSALFTTVQNRPPVWTTVPDQRMALNSNLAFSFQGYVSDPDGNVLTVTVASSSPDIAQVVTTPQGTLAMVSGNKVGSTTITAVASDGHLSASTQFTITTVGSGGGGAPLPSKPLPIKVGAIPTMRLNVGETGDVDLARYFVNPLFGQSMSYAASSSDASIASTSISGTTLTVTGVAVGSATVTVTATNANGSATQSFTVVVGNVNLAPTICATQAAADAIANLETQGASGSNRVEGSLAGIFCDEDGDTLTLTATSSDDSVTVSVAGGYLIAVAEESPWSATIKVTATDPGGLTADFSFNMSGPGVSQTLRVDDVSVAAGESETVTVEHTGFSADPTIELSGNPSWVTVDGLVITAAPPDGTAAGTHTITATGTNGTEEADDTFTVTVTAAPDRPVVIAPDITVQDGTTSCRTPGHDHFSATPTFTVDADVTWITVTGGNVCASPPSGTAEGDHSYTLTGTNGSEEGSGTGTVTVVNESVPPSCHIGDIETVAGTGQSASITHNNFPCTPTAEIESGPDWITVSGLVVTAFPESSIAAGDYDFTVKLSCGSSEAECSGTVTVRPATVVIAPTLTVRRGFSTTGNAVISGFFPFAITSISQNSWVTVNGNRVTAAPPSNTPVGKHRYRLDVEDSEGRSDHDWGDVFVTDPGAFPRIDAPPIDVVQGESIVGTVSYSGFGGVPTFTVSPARTWLYNVGANIHVRPAADQDWRGAYVYTVKAVLGNLSASDYATVTVISSVPVVDAHDVSLYPGESLTLIIGYSGFGSVESFQYSGSAADWITVGATHRISIPEGTAAGDYVYTILVTGTDRNNNEITVTDTGLVTVKG